MDKSSNGSGRVPSGGVARPAADRVAVAEAGVARAVGRLAALVDDPDPCVVSRAAAALARLGPLAAEPLAARLPRATPAHAAVILFTLAEIARKDWRPVSSSLSAALGRTKDPVVWSLILERLSGTFLRDLTELAVRPPERPAP